MRGVSKTGVRWTPADYNDWLARQKQSAPASLIPEPNAGALNGVAMVPPAIESFSIPNSGHGGSTERIVTVKGEPVAAPRMTQRDRWLKRKCVVRYFDYRKYVKSQVGQCEPPDELHCVWFFPMPPSWSKKYRKEMAMTPHRNRPDCDNLLKTVKDALWDNDEQIWKGSFEKFWTYAGQECAVLRMVWRKA